MVGRTRAIAPLLALRGSLVTDHTETLHGKHVLQKRQTEAHADLTDGKGTDENGRRQLTFAQWALLPWLATWRNMCVAQASLQCGRSLLGFLV